MPETPRAPANSKPLTTVRKAPGIIKKPAAPIPAFAQKTTASTPKVSSPAPAATLSAEERHRLIAERAYFLAEKRGFQGGCPQQDWFEAAAYVDQLFKKPDQGN